MTYSPFSQLSVRSALSDLRRLHLAPKSSVKTTVVSVAGVLVTVGSRVRVGNAVAVGGIGVNVGGTGVSVGGLGGTGVLVGGEAVVVGGKGVGAVAHATIATAIKSMTAKTNRFRILSSFDSYRETRTPLRQIEGAFNTSIALSHCSTFKYTSQ